MGNGGRGVEGSTWKWSGEGKGGEVCLRGERICKEEKKKMSRVVFL